MHNAVCFVIWDHMHTRIINRDLYTRGQSRAVEAHTGNEDQSQLDIVAEIAELRQTAQQQAELMQRQAEEAREREEILGRCQN